MIRLLLASIVFGAALALAAAGPSDPLAGGDGSPALLLEQPFLCASGLDGGARPAPHGLLMVVERTHAPPCALGG